MRSYTPVWETGEHRHTFAVLRDANLKFEWVLQSINIEEMFKDWISIIEDHDDSGSYGCFDALNRNAGWSDIKKLFKNLALLQHTLCKHFVNTAKACLKCTVARILDSSEVAQNSQRLKSIVADVHWLDEEAPLMHLGD